MDEKEFDKFAEEYTEIHRKNIRITGEEPDFFSRYKIEDMNHVWSLLKANSNPEHILDFGGGVGASSPHMRELFPSAEIVIADVSRRSLEIADRRNIQNMSTLHFDGETLPISDGTFDMALASCVFHHIPEESHQGLLREIRRVLKPGGLLFVFEHNPWNPLTVHAVNTCPFDENAVLISAPNMRDRMKAAGFTGLSVSFRIFFPGLLRKFRVLEPYLVRVPIGAQYRSVGSA